MDGQVRIGGWHQDTLPASVYTQEYTASLVRTKKPLEASRYLVTMYVGIGDAITVGLSAIDQLLLHDPQAFGKIDVLCNPVQGELFAHDPRVHHVIEASDILFAPPEITAWVKGLMARGEVAWLVHFLRDRHYEAVVAGTFAPGLYSRLQSPVISPSLWQLWRDFLALRKLEDRPMSKIVRRAVNSFFGDYTPLWALSDTIPLYLSSEQIATANKVVTQMKARAGSALHASKLLVVAPDTASEVTRPPTTLLATALIHVLEQYQHLLICILPGYTCARSAENLWRLLAHDYANRVFLAVAQPRASLLETTALIDQADIFLTGDTGVMHLAATEKRLRSDDPGMAPRNATRTIVLFGGTNPALYSYSQRTIIVGRGRKEQMAYRPGIVKESYRLHGRNLFDHITPQMVTHAILSCLSDDP
jgi:ADP-heptose:LPS heptosyltransferase